MEELATFGVLMGLEADSDQHTASGNNNRATLLISCPTADYGAGRIKVTPRMFDLARMGFRDIAVTRWCPNDKSAYAIFSRQSLSEAMRNAVLKDAGDLVSDAVERLELDRHAAVDNNEN